MAYHNANADHVSCKRQSPNVKGGDMSITQEGKDAIVQFIKDSLKPINGGEVLANKGISSKTGHLRKWFIDILEGNVPLMTIDKRYTIIIKWHYTNGVSWRAISNITQIPQATLRSNSNHILERIVDSMQEAQQYGILRIIEDAESARYKHG
jgi:hypothetical protein